MITYKNFNWQELEVPDQLEKQEIRESIISFIEDGLKEYKSVMIVSQKNQCRSVIVALLYLMMKYKWSTLRALEFLASKKPNLQITNEILKYFLRLELDIRASMLEVLVEPTD